MLAWASSVAAGRIPVFLVRPKEQYPFAFADVVEWHLKAPHSHYAFLKSCIGGSVLDGIALRVAQGTDGQQEGEQRKSASDPPMGSHQVPHELQTWEAASPSGTVK